ncbi:MAG: 2,3-bisphosphoglycerate-dependent phosphoglycerate mutase, partial [Gammaproteobacteria bacterium]|nr:2,3-bisphosphoglycerate-dependent phosphoglycerate mutase [Gammaproteobacteria bacterium]
LELSDARHPSHDVRYAGIDSVPASESLKTTLERVKPYWEAEIAPRLSAGENVLIAAHGNSLRALVKMLDNISDSDITEFNIPTGVPIYYELDDNLQPIKREFIGDADAIEKAAAAVAQQAAGK